MKRILKYTIGWDIDRKEGYLTIIDENETSYFFGKLPLPEFQILVDMLKEKKVYIDNKKWLISGWEDPEHP
jgi:hypothetical protein